MSEFFGRHVDVVDVRVFVGFVNHVCLLPGWLACGGCGGGLGFVAGLLIHAVDVVDGVFRGIAGEAVGRGCWCAFALAEEGSGGRS